MTWPTKTDFVDGDVLTAAQVNNIGTNLNLYDPTSATVGQVPVADGAGSVSFGSPAGGAVKIMTPSAVTVGGGTATINADGSVTLTGATGTKSFDGVFDATCRNYLIKMNFYYNTTGGNDWIRWRAAGTDSTSTYLYQWIKANNTTVTAGRGTAASVIWISEPKGSATDPTTITMWVYQPFVAERTYAKSMQISELNTTTIVDFAGFHTQATSYDGFTIGSGFTIDGTITIYGYEE